MKIAIGVALGGLLGAVIGLCAAMYSSWTGFWGYDLFGGLIAGGVPGVVLGYSMAGLACNLASSEQKVSMSPAWGVCTGLVYGASLGPVLCAVCGFTFGQMLMLMGYRDLGLDLLIAGLVVGLPLGPIVSVVAWEACYFIGMGDLLGGPSSDG